jgi:hypothetical protein
MPGQIYLLFSADYELFFGENYLPEREVLIEPTEKILKALEEEGIPMTLFADVASVWRYRSLKIESDYVTCFEDQLRGAVRRGHDVQLHLHPHWMTSTFDGKKWHMDESKFKLSDVGYADQKDQDEVSACELIRLGKDYLEELLRRIDASYQCVAFRAGGYGIQPNDRELIGALLAAGFKIDSSIVPGFFFRSNVNQIDFRKIPSRPNYHLGTRHGIYQEERQGIFEIPIAAYSESLCETLVHHFSMLRKVALHLGNRVCAGKKKFTPRGRTIQKNSRIRLIRSALFRPSLFLLEFGGPSVDIKRMALGTNKLIGSHLKESGDLYLSASCHPKSVFPSTIDAIREFWKRMVQFHGENIRAITFQEAAERVAS